MKFLFLFFPIFLFSVDQFTFDEQLELDEKFSFIGIGSSYSSALIIVDDEKEVVSINDFSLRYGRQSLKWRTTLMFDYNIDSVSFLGVGVNVDYILLDYFLGTSKIRPYLGLGLKYHYYIDSGISDYDYGLQGGFIIYATDFIDIDLGISYGLSSRLEYKNLSYLYDDNMNFGDFFSILGLSVSLHYFY